MKLRLLFCFLILGFCIPLSAQNPHPFWNEIQEFKHQDSLQMPDREAILLVGSSSFRKWTNVSDYFPDFKIINRGFGGSTLLDLIHYEKLIVMPYHPKQIIVYCGENDFAENPNLSPDECLKRFKTLFKMMRVDLPEATIDFVSMKPSPSRVALQEKFTQANTLIKSFLQKQKKTYYIDVVKAMLNDKGADRPELYLEDGLHMNAQGYLIWKQCFLPYLIH